MPLDKKPVTRSQTKAQAENSPVTEQSFIEERASLSEEDAPALTQSDEDVTSVKRATDQPGSSAEAYDGAVQKKSIGGFGESNPRLQRCMSFVSKPKL